MEWNNKLAKHHFVFSNYDFLLKNIVSFVHVCQHDECMWHEQWMVLYVTLECVCMYFWNATIKQLSLKHFLLFQLRVLAHEPFIIFAPMLGTKTTISFLMTVSTFLNILNHLYNPYQCSTNTVYHGKVINKLVWKTHIYRVKSWDVRYRG